MNEPINCVVADLVASPVETVPLARFLASQATVGALLREREVIMDALIGLVNAAHPFRFSAVCLSHEQAMGPAYQIAFALCERWEQAKAATPGSFAPPAATERKEIVIPVIGGNQRQHPPTSGGAEERSAAAIPAAQGNN